MKKFDKITLRQHSDNANFRIFYPEKEKDFTHKREGSI